MIAMTISNEDTWVDRTAARLPEGVEIRLIRTRSERISDRLNMLMENGLAGLALVQPRGRDV